MTSSLSSTISAAQQKAFVTYSAPYSAEDHYEITLLEAPSLLASSGTTGFRTWEAALLLGQYFCSSVGTHYVHGQSIIELGAGTGLLSLLCAKHLGAQRVLATDGSHQVLDDIQTNLTLNDLSENASIEVAQLQWGHSLIGGIVDPAGKGHTYDVAFGADVVGDLLSRFMA